MQEREEFENCEKLLAKKALFHLYDKLTENVEENECPKSNEECETY